MEDSRKIIKMKDNTLIHPTEIDREPVYEDFISRVDFINQTGIFVTPGYFETIYDDFKESGVSVDEFVGSYEEKYSTCVQETELKGTFKYETTDDEVSCLCVYDSTYDDLNIWEVVNNLAVEYDHQWRSKDEIVEKYQKIIQELQDINTRLMDIATKQASAVEFINTGENISLLS